MRQQYYNDLGRFDKRFSNRTGIVYFFDNEKEFDYVCSDLSENIISNRHKLVAIEFGDFLHKSKY